MGELIGCFFEFKIQNPKFNNLNSELLILNYYNCFPAAII